MKFWVRLLIFKVNFEAIKNQKFELSKKFIILLKDEPLTDDKLDKLPSRIEIFIEEFSDSSPKLNPEFNEFNKILESKLMN